MNRLLRAWLLIVFAALLPLRGVAAASLLCQAAAPAHAAHAEHHDMAPDAHGGHHDPAKGAAAAEPDPGCTLCCAVGGATALPGVAASVAPPAAVARLAYPPLSAPPPRFEASGPERPPRAA